MPDRKEETTVKTHILMYQRWTDREIENQLFAEYAKSYPDEQKIIELINHGADINAVDNKGESLLINAIGSVNFGLDLKFIWLLIDAGVDISSTVGGGNCPLHGGNERSSRNRFNAVERGCRSQQHLCRSPGITARLGRNKAVVRRTGSG